MTSVWQKQRTKSQIRTTHLRRTLTRYFYSGWKPAAVCFLLVSLLTLVGAMNETALLSSTYIATGLSVLCGVCIAIAFVGLVAATVWNLVKKRWIQSTLSICLLVGVCYSLNMAIANLFLFAADDAALENAVMAPPAAEVSEMTAPTSVSSAFAQTEFTQTEKPVQKQPAPTEKPEKKEAIQQMPAGLAGY